MKFIENFTYKDIAVARKMWYNIIVNALADDKRD